MLEPILLISPHALVFLSPGPDMCDFCGALLQIGEFPACGGDPARHGPAAAHRPFPSFEHDGRTVGSIQAADRIERETETRSRSEPGAAPIRFRAFHQDQSNYDRNTFGPSPQVATPKRGNVRGGFSDKARTRDVHPAVRRIRGE